MPAQQSIESLDTLNQRFLGSSFIDDVLPLQKVLAQLPQSAPPAILNLVVPPSMSLRAAQTPTKPQLGRNTCWCYSAIAALEAAYLRSHGVVLNLSEHYFNHIAKSHESDGGVSSMDGGGGNSGSVAWLEKVLLPAAIHVPFLDQPAMVTLRSAIPEAGGVNENVPGTQSQRDAIEYDTRSIPLPGRWSARYGVPPGGWVYLQNYSNTDIEKVLASGKEVVVDVLAGPAQRAHAVLLVGYNRPMRVFEAKNSWGPQGQYDVVPYDDNTPNQMSLSRNLAAYVTKVIAPNAVPPLHAAWVGVWEMDHDGWRGRLFIRRVVNLHGLDPRDQGSARKLGTYLSEAGVRQDVNGYLVDNGQRLIFHIAPQGNTSGKLVGQRFEVMLFGRDLMLAAGTTAWNGQTFGVTLSRGVLPGIPSPTFNRNEAIGTWSFRHDGWLGALRLGAPAVYRDTANVQRAVRAEIAATQFNVAVDVPFDPRAPQRFELALHTREDGVMSGVTRQAGRVFGVAGRLQAPLYALAQDGRLQWYGHEGRVGGTFEWTAARQVRTGWNDFAQVIPGGDGVLYTVTRDGRLLWHRHAGRAQGTDVWQGPREVGTGWNAFRQVVGAPGGVLYAIRHDGTMLWYRHKGRGDGTFTWEGPKTVGEGWNMFKHVFAGDWGTLYGIHPSGALNWYRHDGQATGSGAWTGRRRVNAGWAGFRTVFAAECGTIYAIQEDGTLLWYRHVGAVTGTDEWLERKVIGSGWSAFRAVCAS